MKVTKKILVEFRCFYEFLDYQKERYEDKEDFIEVEVSVDKKYKHILK